jgi:hypothetical protein
VNIIFDVDEIEKKYRTELTESKLEGKRNKQASWSEMQANYTDWATATCWRNLVLTFADRGVSRGQRSGTPTAVNPSFLDRSRYFSFK